MVLQLWPGLGNDAHRQCRSLRWQPRQSAKPWRWRRHPYLQGIHAIQEGAGIRYGLGLRCIPYDEQLFLRRSRLESSSLWRRQHPRAIHQPRFHLRQWMGSANIAGGSSGTWLASATTQIFSLYRTGTTTETTSSPSLAETRLSSPSTNRATPSMKTFKQAFLLEPTVTSSAVTQPEVVAQEHPSTLMVLEGPTSPFLLEKIRWSLCTLELNPTVMVVNATGDFSSSD